MTKKYTYSKHFTDAQMHMMSQKTFGKRADKCSGIGLYFLEQKLKAINKK